MPLTVLTAPEALPISVFEVRQAARVEHSQHDVRIERLIEAAVAYAREQHGIVCLTTALRYEQHGTGAYRAQPMPVALPISHAVPVAISAVTIEGQQSTALVLYDDYDALGGNVRLYRYPVRGERVRVDFTAGWGSAEDVPEPIRQWIVQSVVDAYEAGDGFVQGTISRLPTPDWMGPYRLMSV